MTRKQTGAVAATATMAADPYTRRRVRIAYVDVLGRIWMPATWASLRIDLRDYDLENIGEFTRENVEQWLCTHAGDFQSVKDFCFRAVCGDAEIAWSSEESEGDETGDSTARAAITAADKCPTCGRRFSTPRSDSNGVKVSASDAAEARKQVKDRARAESAIVALDRVLANPSSLLTRCGDVLAPDFMEAVTAERVRLSVALLSSDALRGIYRRNEKGTAQHG